MTTGPYRCGKKLARPTSRPRRRSPSSRERAGNHEAAIRYRLRVLELDPYDEPAHLGLVARSQRPGDTARHVGPTARMSSGWGASASKRSLVSATATAARGAALRPLKGRSATLHPWSHIPEFARSQPLSSSLRGNRLGSAVAAVSDAGGRTTQARRPPDRRADGRRLLGALRPQTGRRLVLRGNDYHRVDPARRAPINHVRGRPLRRRAGRGRARRDAGARLQHRARVHGGRVRRAAASATRARGGSRAPTSPTSPTSSGAPSAIGSS